MSVSRAGVQVRRRRVWSETLELSALRSPEVTRMLSRYGLEVMLAARPHERPELPRTLEALAGRGISVALWPMLEDHEGRWPNARNAERFGAYVAEMLNELNPLRASFGAVVFDLEPSFAEASAWIARLRGEPARHTVRPGRHIARATELFEELIRDIRAEGLEVYSAVVPMVLADAPSPRASGWQRWMGTPVDALRWDHASVMLYTSIFEGWSREALRREDAVSLLAEGARATARRFGAAAGVSLGAVGTGALGDEPVYRSASELAEDVSVAMSEGINDLSLFDLGGIFARRPAERWLAAFTESEALGRTTALTLRAKAVAAAAMAISRVAAMSVGSKIISDRRKTQGG